MRLIAIAAMTVALMTVGTAAHAQDFERIRCTSQSGRVLDWTIDLGNDWVRYRDAGEIAYIDWEAAPSPSTPDVDEYAGYFSIFWEGRSTGISRRIFFFREQGALPITGTPYFYTAAYSWEEWTTGDPTTLRISGGPCVERPG